MHIAVVIPLYNNPNTVLDVALACQRHLPDVFVVDDASTELPSGFAESLAEHGIRCLRHEKNQGYGAAVMTGIAELGSLGFDYAITLDADGQHSPDDIPAFVRLLEAECQEKDTIVVGVRDFSSPDIPKSSRFGRDFSNFWVKLESGVACEDTQSGFRAYPVAPMLKMRCISKRYTFAVESLVRGFWGGLQLRELPVHVTYAPKGKYVSHFRPFADNLRFSLLHTWLVTRRLLPWPMRRLVPKPTKSATPNPFRHPLQFLRFLLWENSTPQLLAVSAGVSTFLAVLPLLSCHMLVILYVCVCLRLNKAMALAIQNLYMPPLSPFLCIELGYWMRNGQFLREASMQTIVKEIHLRLLDWLLGSLILAPLFAVIAGALTYLIAKRLQRREAA